MPAVNNSEDLTEFSRAFRLGDPIQNTHALRGLLNHQIIGIQVLLVELVM